MLRREVPVGVGPSSDAALTTALGDLVAHPESACLGGRSVSHPDDGFAVRAEMDLHVSLTTCSPKKSNGGTGTPIDDPVRPADVGIPDTDSEELHP